MEAKESSDNSEYPDCNYTVELRNVETDVIIQSLPILAMERIFWYMTHTEKLISRLVCKDWSNQMSSFLTNSSQFVLASRDSNEAALDSNVEWTKIRISDYRSTFLQNEFKNSVTTLQLDFSGIPNDSTTWKKLLIGFPNVTDLHLNITGLQVPEDPPEEDITQARDLRQNLQPSLVKLKSLSVTFSFNSLSVFTALNECLEEFVFGEMYSLNKLSVIERLPLATARRWPERKPSNADTITELLNNIYSIIYTSGWTLKHLELEFHSRDVRLRLMEELVKKISQLNCLKLESVLIRHVPFQDPNEINFFILQDFLKKQMTSGNLKNIILPYPSSPWRWWPWTSNPLYQELISLLPSDIETVGNIHAEHITAEFLENFMKLNSLSFVGKVTTEIEMFKQRDSFQESFGHVGKRILTFDHHGTLYVFTNLTELRIRCGRVFTFHGSDLRNIIRNGDKLRVLHLQDCNVTDAGVIGLDRSDENDAKVQELILTKRMYFYSHFIPEEDLGGYPLSSLKMLEKLVLLGSRITDVGITLGLQFGSQLKELTIDSSSMEVSDLGLCCLGASNPDLEAFYGSFKSPKISTVGIEDFRQQLPLTEFTQKFRLVNEIPEEPSTPWN